MAAKEKEIGFVKCADCGRIVDVYSDGEKVRVAVHDVCGMGGQPLEVQVRARRLQMALSGEREVQA